MEIGADEIDRRPMGEIREKTLEAPGGEAKEKRVN